MNKLNFFFYTLLQCNFEADLAFCSTKPSVSERGQVQRARHDADGYHRVTSNRHGMLCMVAVSQDTDVSGSVLAVGCGVQVWVSLGIFTPLLAKMLWKNLWVGFW